MMKEITFDHHRRLILDREIYNGIFVLNDCPARRNLLRIVDDSVIFLDYEFSIPSEMNVIVVGRYLVSSTDTPRYHIIVTPYGMTFAGMNEIKRIE